VVTKIPKLTRSIAGSAGSAGDSADSTCDESECSSGSRSRKKARSFLEISSFDWLATYFRCDTIVHDLERLEGTPILQLNDVFFCHYLQVLQRLRNGQGCMYQAGAEFKRYFDEQSRALESYTVRTVDFDALKKENYVMDMDSSLRATYTNAFTKNELVVISCLLAYPGLSFCNIRQKTSKSLSDGAVRGMAFVPVQLEDFFQRRLRLLGILDDVHHPKYMAGLSTVVLSSTYCYHQLGSWRHLASWESASSLVLQLQNFPSFLSIDGVYVRVQHTFETAFHDLGLKSAPKTSWT